MESQLNRHFRCTRTYRNEFTISRFSGGLIHHMSTAETFERAISTPPLVYTL